MSAGGSAWRELRAGIRADHEALRRAGEKYGGAGASVGPLLVDLVRKVGFQLLAAYRVMRLLSRLRIPGAPLVVSRLIRHLYGADIHWRAQLEPGVMVVHGMGLCISHAARVGTGSVLFQNVTLGEGIDPVSREVGSPLLEADVHVGPGATLLGPIVIGAGTKVMAGCVVMRSVAARSLVEAPSPLVRPREAASDPASRPGAARTSR